MDALPAVGPGARGGAQRPQHQGDDPARRSGRLDPHGAPRPPARRRGRLPVPRVDAGAGPVPLLPGGRQVHREEDRGDALAARQGRFDGLPAGAERQGGARGAARPADGGLGRADQVQVRRPGRAAEEGRGGCPDRRGDPARPRLPSPGAKRAPLPAGEEIRRPRLRGAGAAGGAVPLPAGRGEPGRRAVHADVLPPRRLRGPALRRGPRGGGAVPAGGGEPEAVLLPEAEAHRRGGDPVQGAAAGQGPRLLREGADPDPRVLPVDAEDEIGHLPAGPPEHPAGVARRGGRVPRGPGGGGPLPRDPRRPGPLEGDAPRHEREPLPRPVHPRVRAPLLQGAAGHLSRLHGGHPLHPVRDRPGRDRDVHFAHEGGGGVPPDPRDRAEPRASPPRGPFPRHREGEGARPQQDRRGDRGADRRPVGTRGTGRIGPRLPRGAAPADGQRLAAARPARHRADPLLRRHRGNGLPAGPALFAHLRGHEGGGAGGLDPVEGDAPGRAVREGAQRPGPGGPQAPVRGAGAPAARAGARVPERGAPGDGGSLPLPRGRPVSPCNARRPVRGALPDPRGVRRENARHRGDRPAGIGDHGVPRRLPRRARPLREDRGDAVGQQHEHPERLDRHHRGRRGAGHVLRQLSRQVPAGGPEEGARHRGPFARPPGGGHRGGAHGRAAGGEVRPGPRPPVPAHPRRLRQHGLLALHRGGHLHLRPDRAPLRHHEHADGAGDRHRALQDLHESGPGRRRLLHRRPGRDGRSRLPSARRRSARRSSRPSAHSVRP